jgi:hypothetical protein
MRIKAMTNFTYVAVGKKGKLLGKVQAKDAGQARKMLRAAYGKNIGVELESSYRHICNLNIGK